MRMRPSSALVLLALVFALLTGVVSASITTVDLTGTVGQYSSIQFDNTAGVPVISYYDTTDTSLQLARCNDAACTAPTITTVASNGGLWTSLQLDSNRFPVIAYVDGATVRVAHCGDLTCSTVTSDSIVDTGLLSPSFVSMRLNSSGFPVVAYHTQGNAAAAALKVAICADAACTALVGGVPVILSSGAIGAGANASLVLDSGNRPIVSYGYRVASGPPVVVDLRVTRCDDASCASATTNTVDAGALGNASDYTSIQLDSSGFPVISYYDPTPSLASLKLAHCTTVDCSGTININTIDRGTTTGVWSSLELHPVTGFPLVSYFRSGPGNVAALAACADANCTSSAISLLDNTVAASASFTSSLALSSAGVPYVSYYQANAGTAGSNDLRLYANEGYIVDFGSPNGLEGGSISFTPTLNTPAPAGGLTVAYTTLLRHADTASATDFTAASGSVSFAAGQTSASSAVSVTTAADLDIEGSETLSVVVSPAAPVSAQAVYGRNGTWTILETPLPIVSIDDVSQTEGTGGTSTLSFTVSLDIPATFAVSVPFTVSDVTATSPDYSVTTSSPVVIPIGSTSADISVDIVTDAFDESDESFEIQLGAPTNAELDLTPANTLGIGTILDDDTAGITFTDEDNVVIREGGVLDDSYTVVLDSEPLDDVTLTLTFDDTQMQVGVNGGAFGGTPAVLTFTPLNWNVAQSVAVTGIEDFVVDPSIEIITNDPSSLVDGQYNGLASTPVSVQIIDGFVEHILNGSFEVAGATPESALGWTGVRLSLANDKRMCDKPGKIVANDGVCAFRFRFDGVIVNLGGRVIKQIISTPGLSSGDQLTISADVNAKGLTSAGRLSVKVKYAGGTSQVIKAVVPAGTYAYTGLTATGTLTDVPLKFIVKITPKQATGVMFVDAVSLQSFEAGPRGAGILPPPSIPGSFRR